MDTQLQTPVKPIRLYEACQIDLEEMSEDHFELVLHALTEHGCCVELKVPTYQPTFTRIK